MLQWCGTVFIMADTGTPPFFLRDVVSNIGLSNHYQPLRCPLNGSHADRNLMISHAFLGYRAVVSQVACWRIHHQSTSSSVKTFQWQPHVFAYYHRHVLHIIGPIICIHIYLYVCVYIYIIVYMYICNYIYIYTIFFLKIIHLYIFIHNNYIYNQIII